MRDTSVIICTHNPRQDHLQRVLGALNGQTLPKDKWELLVVDNASKERLANTYDLSWHPRARHVREEDLGLTLARFRGITEARGELLVFVDDDNVLASDYLEEASTICDRHPHLGAFGSGSLEPEFEVQPPREIRSRLPICQAVSSARWSNNARDHESVPWGAGLCVRRPVASAYQEFVERLGLTAVLGRRGKELFCGDDDVFSWVAAAVGDGFGIFPQLRARHLIVPGRLNRRYVLRLIRGHAFSHGVLQHMLEGRQARRIDWNRCVRVLLHGVKNGQFSMQCRWAEARGEDSAAQFLAAKNVRSSSKWLPRRDFRHLAQRHGAPQGAHIFSDLSSVPAGDGNDVSSRAGGL